jgi:Tfp pilus assembly protein PilN
MAKIDFVPNDYIQQRDSNRANFLYLILFSALMGGIIVTFSIIKLRQKSVEAELQAAESKMSKAHAQISQLENLKAKSSTMIKTMAVTGELIERVPRSVVLACVTNNLPSGVSLLDFKLKQKELKPAASGTHTSQYKSASAAASDTGSAATERIEETNIELEGIAPSDIEVAAYIAQLEGSILLDNVELVESKEHKIDAIAFRQFKLKASINNEVLLTHEDIDRIKAKRKQMM